VAEYLSVDVSGWEVINLEPQGSKPDKLWLRAPHDGPVTGRDWLFKPRTVQREVRREFFKGDDWAEKLAAEVAAKLGVAAAQVELARRGDQLGIISRSVSQGRALVLGNQVLSSRNPEYDPDRRGSVPGYTAAAVLGALQELEALPPAGGLAEDACSAFAGYLSLDALIANTDRHHENWGVLTAAPGVQVALAASFDHASSFGFQLSDEEREERLSTRDKGRDVKAFAEKGRSRYFAGTPTLLELAKSALSLCDKSAVGGYRRRLEALDEEAVNSLVRAVPADRMTHPCRKFCVRLMDINRRRLLDELDRSS